ncbi:GIY-YIG nuclease family protein [Cohnella silvisoli]|uniref:GIY-YIG nuclease family protein n=1 Tax=Cohnella silvisoli TaxID=2873699 RepID=A0ABV1KZP4_9BACL|nr:GIY-YIG nuclease family protein [Cohnella silvisoli]MCD9021848.1 GIY-YIG nuclease family protein [Cohnella silvisoli]
MNRKEERAKLIQQFKEIPIEAGVYQIRNTVNGKVFIDSTLNLRSLNGRSGTLQAGTHSSRALQKEWNEYGSQAFVMEVLEVLKPSDNPFVVQKDELKKLEKSWIEKLQPYGERGYHIFR